MKNRFFILWLIWSLLAVVLVVIVLRFDAKQTLLTTISTVISIAPIFGLMLALGSQKASHQFKELLQNNANSIYYSTGFLTLLFAVPGIFTNSFNPYNTAIFAFILLAVFSLLKQLKNERFALSWTDITLWILLWIPFDLRWYTKMQPMLDYNWWSVTISVVALIGWLGYRNADLGYRLVPKFKDFRVTFFALIGIVILVVPPGIITGFLNFEVPDNFDIPELAVLFIGIFLTIALPEELFFRGLLLKGLENISSKKWVPMVVSSFAFGLMHWNNISGLNMQITYVLLATIAGFGYAWAYKKSGNNLLAAILTHTLVDWIWNLVFGG